MGEQLNFNDMMVRDYRDKELTRPWFQQNSSARLVEFVGDKSPHNQLKKGDTGVVVGSGSGELDTFFQTRGKLFNVSYLDLFPLKVTEFSDDEKTQEWPKRFEYVQIVSNATMKVVAEGILGTVFPERCCLIEKTERGYTDKEWCDLKVHHFKGYEPKRMLIYKDEIENAYKGEY